MTVYASSDFRVLPPLRYDLIVADPPWPFELRSTNGEKKSPQRHYAVMSLPAIAALPVAQLCQRNAWLFLWTTAPLLDRQMDVLKAWGFAYKTNVVWRKVTANGKNTLGPGYVARTRHELLLVGSIGKPWRQKALDSLFDGVRREHSRKPDEFYAALDRFAPSHHKLDLFSRTERPGWDSWGLEAGKFEKAAA